MSRSGLSDCVVLAAEMGTRGLCHATDVITAKRDGRYWRIVHRQFLQFALNKLPRCNL